MKIIIMRHGKPRISGWPKIRADELSTWIDAYAQAGVSGTATEEAVRAAAACRIIVTSDLARSTGSARALEAGSGRVLSEKLFREATWPFAVVPFLRFRPYTWAAVFRVLWFLGYGNNCREPVAALKRRAAAAADRLIELARTHDSVLLVGHGILNTFIVRALRERGWKGPTLPGYGYWSCSEYTKSAER